MATPRRGPWRATGEPVGFTLIELLVVLTILVLVAALVAPSFTRQYHTAKLNSTARDTMALMQYARSQAVVEATTYRLNIDSDGGRMWVTYYDTELEADRPLDEEPQFTMDESVLGAARNVPDEVTLAELALGDEALSQLSPEAMEQFGASEERLNEEGTPYITFQPSGTTDGARILFENEYDDQVAVALDAITGRTEIEDIYEE